MTRADTPDHPGFSANVSILFTELPYLERFAAARSCGFRAVESWWPFADPVASRAEVDDLCEVVTTAGVALSALNLYAGDMTSGERGMCCRPDRQSELDANLEQVLLIAARTGCRQFNLLYGQLDDRWTTDEQHACAVAAYRRVAQAVTAVGGTVLIEPLARGLNGDYPLQTGEDVVELITGPLGGADGVALLFDLFHLGSNGVDLVTSVDRLLPWIGHVQVADSPGRGEPGTGRLPIADTLRTLWARGYDGLVACEYQPSTTTADTFGWLDDVAAPLLAREQA